MLHELVQTPIAPRPSPPDASFANSRSDLASIANLIQLEWAEKYISFYFLESIENSIYVEMFQAKDEQQEANTWGGDAGNKVRTWMDGDQWWRKELPCLKNIKWWHKDLLSVNKKP